MSLPEIVHQHDIGLYVNKPATETIDLFPGLQNLIWTPPEDYKFPVSEKRNLKFQRSWLLKYKWLAYSAILNGVFCKYCVLFSVGGGGIGHQKLGLLVKKPFTNWKKALESFSYHNSLEYHKTSLLKSNMRAEMDNQNILPVDLQISEQQLDFINKSKKCLIPIIETLILCGRQGLALRGSNDSGRITSEEPLTNDGNFRALLRYRAKTDDQLNTFLQNSSKNAMYISNRIQNEFIVIFHNLIQKYIIERVNKSQAFSVTADETADIAGIEQVSICVRYLNNDDGKLKICEDFLSFVPVADVTGKGLSNVILDFLEYSGIDCAYLFGQGYDGASTMSGEFHGVQAYIREKYHLAIYSHCAAHSFNLAVSAACSIPQIRNCLGTVQSIYNFFNTPKRLIALHDAIQNNETLLQEKKKKLKKYCATRWVQQHESIGTYIDLQPAVIDALENISSTWTDSKTTSGSFQLLSAIKTLEFQVSIHVLHSVHALALSLSRVLQTENQDLVEAVKLADAAKHKLEERRQYSTENFSKIFVTVEDICKKYNIPVTKPRLASRQTNRSNIIIDSVADYYKIIIYIPYHDLFITHLQDRFLKHRNILSNFSCLFPVETKSLDKVACKTLFETYSSILHDDSPEIWISEVEIWRRRLVGKNIRNALDALDICNADAFPNVHKMLRVMSVLPVTTTTNERSFSTLRRLKTYLRSTMGEDRLNGLVSLNIHRDINVDINQALNQFFSVPRRVRLLKK